MAQSLLAPPLLNLLTEQQLLWELYIILDAIPPPQVLSNIFIIVPALKELSYELETYFNASRDCFNASFVTFSEQLSVYSHAIAGLFQYG